MPRNDHYLGRELTKAEERAEGRCSCSPMNPMYGDDVVRCAWCIVAGGLIERLVDEGPPRQDDGDRDQRAPCSFCLADEGSEHVNKCIYGLAVLAIASNPGWANR